MILIEIIKFAQANGLNPSVTEQQALLNAANSEKLGNANPDVSYWKKEFDFWFSIACIKERRAK